MLKKESSQTMKSIFLRYLVASFGLFLVALGIAVSLKSNLGTAPPSCPPCVLNLKWESISVGQFTWMMHLTLILFQIALLRKKFRLIDLMQIPAAFFFGYLCDVCIWLCQGLPSDTYALQLVWNVLAIIITAIGLRIEINGNAWMLSGDRTCAVVAEVFNFSFSNVKIAFDILFVVASVLFAWFAFGNFFGDGETNVIREGTLLLAVFTGLCMKVTDPLVEKIFKPL